MNSKKIIIFDYDILFNILNEIKGNLNFDVNFRVGSSICLQNHKTELTNHHFLPF